jgi:hypothetical protein
LRVARAQLSGWLEGLFRGLQTLIAAQQGNDESFRPPLLGERPGPTRTRAVSVSPP